MKPTKKVIALALSLVLSATAPGISLCAKEVNTSVAEELMTETPVSDSLETADGEIVEAEEEFTDDSYMTGESVSEEPASEQGVSEDSVSEDTISEDIISEENPSEELIPEGEDLDFMEEETESEEEELPEEAKTIAEAGSILREAMVAREESIEIAIAEDADFGVSDVDAILDEAYKHTGKGNEGDYLKRSVVFSQIHFDEVDGKYVLYFEECYTTTAAQEAEVDAQIKAIESTYKISARTSTYEKILAIYEYIGDSVNYDYDRKDNAVEISDKDQFVPSNYIQQTAYAALVNRYAVCEGYAMLFYRLCLEYGIDTRIVTGESYGDLHGWNVVKLGSSYYYVDATWDSGSGRSDFRYFLKSKYEFPDHTLDVKSEAMVNSLPMATDNYSLKSPSIKTSGIYKYVISYGAIIVGINNSSTGSITIPSTLGGYPVVSLDCSMYSDGNTDYYNTTGIVFPEGLLRIKGYYWIFDAVKTVTFPSTLSLNSESMNVLNLDELTTIKLRGGSKTLKVVDNVLYSKDGSILYKYPGKSSATSYKVLSGTKEIVTCAFRNASNLVSVSLPESLEVIGSYVFECCGNLSSINIPSGLKKVGQWVFYETKLSGTIQFPASMEWINGADFKGTKVTGLEIPEGNSFGYFTLNGILCLDYNHENYKQVVEAPPLMKNPKFSVPDDFVYVTDNSFKGTNLKEISLNEGLIDLGSCAFEECPYLTNVIVPSSVRSINDRSFGFNGTSLKSVYILSKTLDIYGEPFFESTTTVYGYAGSTIQTYCKENGITFKTITEPVYNWGVDGERCSLTMLDASGSPVVYQADQITKTEESGVVTYVATFKVNGTSYTEKKTVKGDYTLSLKASSTSISASTTLTVSGVKENAKVTFKSSDKSIATVDSTGKVTPVSVGRVVITATTEATTHYNKQIAELELMVVPKTTKLSSVTGTSTGVKLTWSENDCVQGYKIYRDSTLIKTIKGYTVTSYTDTEALENGRLYTYKLVGYSEAGSGEVMNSKVSSLKYYYLTRPSITVTNGSSSCKLSWSKNTEAGGYYIYRSINGAAYKKIKTITTPDTVSFTDTGANVNGQKYSYKVIAYKTISETTYTSLASPAKTYYFVVRTGITDLTCTAKNTMTVKWTKKSGVTGYQIQYSTDSKFASGNKTVTVSGYTTVSKSIASLVKGTTYYVRIRCYKTVGSTKYYAAWGPVKSLKITK